MVKFASSFTLALFLLIEVNDGEDLHVLFNHCNIAL